VELVAEGLTNSQIAERMFISPGTVKTHLRNIFKKVDVHRRSELTAEAVRRGPPG
jgi:DNA-binding CsgD family transcriptional regulator